MLRRNATKIIFTWNKIWIIAVIDATFAAAKRKLEKIQACTGFEPLTSAIPVQRSYQMSEEAHLAQVVELLRYEPVNYPWKDDDEVMNIRKSYMRTVGWRIIWKKIIRSLLLLLLQARPQQYTLKYSTVLPYYHTLTKFPKFLCIACLFDCFFISFCNASTPRQLCYWKYSTSTYTIPKVYLFIYSFAFVYAITNLNTLCLADS